MSLGASYFKDGISCRTYFSEKTKKTPVFNMIPYLFYFKRYVALIPVFFLLLPPSSRIQALQTPLLTAGNLSPTRRKLRLATPKSGSKYKKNSLLNLKPIRPQRPVSLSLCPLHRFTRRQPCIPYVPPPKPFFCQFHHLPHHYPSATIRPASLSPLFLLLQSPSSTSPYLLSTLLPRSSLCSTRTCY